MAICADQRDFRDAFKKHYSTYKQYTGAGSSISRRLLLIYCVECGLKYMLMKKEKIFRIADAQDSIQKFLYSHDIHRLLKVLHEAGPYSFPPIRTVHKDVVRVDTYHQLCRYAVRVSEADQGLIQRYDEQLREIADWLGERVQ